MNKLFKGRKNLIKGTALFLAATVLAVALSPSQKVMAVYNKEEAVTFGEFAASHQIENGSLFIGVFVIPLNQLNDSNYQVALDMESEADQYQKYYKSELAGGAWYDVSSAEGIGAITSSGQLADVEEMNKLYVRYYVGTDGVTYDAKTNAPIFLFDINAAYDVTKIKELQPLYQLYKGTFDEEKSKGVDRYYYLALRSFFGTTSQKLRDSTTDLCDQELQGLYAAYVTANNAGKKEEAAIILDLQEKVDALRRSIVYQKLGISTDDKKSFLDELDLINQQDTYEEYCAENKIYSLREVTDYFNKPREGEEETEEIAMSRLYSKMPGTPYDGGTLDKEEFKVNEGIKDAIQTAIGDCGTAYNTYNAKALVDSEKVLAHAEYYKSMQVVYSAASGGSLDGFIDELITIKNIGSNTIKDAKKELAAIDGGLLGEAENKYKSELSKGVGTKYQSVESQGGDESAKKTALEEQMSELESARSELEFLVNAKKSRLSSAEAINFINERINIADSYQKSIVKDAFKDNAMISVKSHTSFLKGSQAEVTNSDESLKSELEKLQEQKEELQRKKAEALDENDLNEAARVDKLMETVDKAISDEKDRLNAIANDKNASAADKAGAENSLNGTMEGSIASLRDKAIDAINSGNDASAALQGLKDLGAVEALKEVAEATGNKEANKALDEAQAEKAKEEAKAAADGSGNGSGKDSGSGDTSSTAADGSGKDDAGKDSEDKKDEDSDDEDSEDEDSKDEDSEDKDKTDDDSQDSKDAQEAAEKAKEKAEKQEAQRASGVTEDDFNQALKDILGGEFGNLDPDGKVIAAAVANRIGQKGNLVARDLAGEWINACANERNIYVYSKVNSAQEADFASAEVIGKVTDYRYIYDSSKKEATLSEKGKAYNFNGGSDVMTSGSKSKIQMDEAAVYKNRTVYISGNTTKDIFNLEVENMEESKYNAVLTEEMEHLADKLYSALVGK